MGSIWNSCLKAISLTIMIGLIAMTASCGGGEVTNNSEDVNPDISNLPPTIVVIITPEPIHTGDLVMLDASTSIDPEGEEMTYTWSQSSGAEVTLSFLEESVVTFTAPAVGTYEFELIVTDASGSSTTMTVEVVVIDDGTVVIDDDIVMNAVFVSAATGSDDPDQDGSYAAPVKTIGRAIEVAGANALTDIFVMEGTYEETVALANGIDIKGCVSSVDAEGTVTLSSNNSATILQAPVGAASAITATSVVGASIDCLTVTGGTEPTSYGIKMSGSQGIEITNVSFTTPGQTGGNCRDIDVIGGDTLTVNESDFRNGGNCNDYIGISIDNSDDAIVDSNSFTFESVTETYLKAVRVTSSDAATISNATVTDGGTPLPYTAVMTVITLGDTTGATVSDTDISIQGAKLATGISLRCTAISFASTVSDNSIELYGASEGVTGVRINCPMPSGTFTIHRNRMDLSPIANQNIPVTAIKAAMSMRPATVDVVNNIITMSLVANDKADKAALVLEKLNASSTVTAMHNNFIIIGNQGDLTAISSDRDDVQFSTIGNLIFIYGGSTDNAVFTLKGACATTWCAEDIVGNMINTDFYSQPLDLVYYYDTLGVEALDVANECDDATPPAQCLSGDVDRRDNSIPSGLVLPYFDMDAGEFLPAYQGYVQDLGPTGTGVDIDFNGSVRSDGTPDIGAVEY